jgi:hypothetical protein
MPNSIITVVLTAVGVYAMSSAQPVNRALNPGRPDVLGQRPAQVVELGHAAKAQGVPFQNEPQDIHNLLLEAAGVRVGAIAPGKIRIPIPVDGVLYEVIVVSPSLPKLIPTSRNNAD